MWATLIVAGGNPPPPALNDNPVMLFTVNKNSPFQLLQHILTFQTFSYSVLILKCFQKVLKSFLPALLFDMKCLLHHYNNFSLPIKA